MHNQNTYKTRQRLLTIFAASSMALCAATAAAGEELSCLDFQRNPNGSWSPLKPVSIGGVQMTPGVQFTPGVSFSGIDLAAELNRQCK